MGYLIPCARIALYGSGLKCVEGNLCDACLEVTALRCTAAALVVIHNDCDSILSGDDEMDSLSERELLQGFRSTAQEALGSKPEALQQVSEGWEVGRVTEVSGEEQRAHQPAQATQLWLLRIKPEAHLDQYDTTYSMVVRADSAEAARAVAVAPVEAWGSNGNPLFAFGDEGQAPWLDPALSSCVPVPDRGPAILILRAANSS